MNRHDRRKALRLGATGTYPEGKVNKQDEGGIRFAIGRDQQGNVVIDFGKDVSWIAMQPEQAMELGRRIMAQAGAKKITVEV